jgi:hypothetical protein
VVRALDNDAACREHGHDALDRRTSVSESGKRGGECNERDGRK